MELSNYDWPKVKELDLVFGTFNVPADLLEEAKKRKLNKGRAKFKELFFLGGKVEFKDNVKGTWREKAFSYARALMNSFKPKHEDKESVCAMIFEETLKL
jgi:hypothetical protein